MHHVGHYQPPVNVHPFSLQQGPQFIKIEDSSSAQQYYQFNQNDIAEYDSKI